MSFKKITLAAVAALCLPAAQAIAVPSISLSDNGTDTITLSVTLDAAGSIGAEIALEATDLTLTGATIADAVAFDEANPGDNPFIAGSPTGGDAVGLDVSGLASGQIFASFGGPGTAAGTYDFLDITYTGAGSLVAEGIVAQLGVLGDPLMADITIGGFKVGDMNGDDAVDFGDITPFVDALGDRPTYEANFPGLDADARGDVSGDGAFDFGDITPFVDLLSGSSAVATPEPASFGLALLGCVALSSRRLRK